MESGTEALDFRQPGRYIPDMAATTGTSPTAFLNVRPELSVEGAVMYVREALEQSDDLRRKPWKGHKNPYAGHCYIACEAVKALAYEPLYPCHMKVGGVSHWFLIDADDNVVDPTADQFPVALDYSTGRGCGFLTKQPSRRARTLIERTLVRRAAYDFRTDRWQWQLAFTNTIVPTRYTILTGIGY